MIIIEELKENNGVSLVASETEFLEQIEKFIGEKIPCREDRDEAKRKVAESYQAYQHHKEHPLYKIKKLEETEETVTVPTTIDWDTFLGILEDIVESDRLRQFHESKKKEIGNLITQLKNRFIDDVNFIMQISQLFSQWLMMHLT